MIILIIINNNRNDTINKEEYYCCISVGNRGRSREKCDIINKNGTVRVRWS